MDNSWPFPLFLPMNSSFTYFSGYIGNSLSNLYEFSLSLKSFNNLQSGIISCSIELSQLLGSSGILLLKQRLLSSSSVEIFLIEVNNLIERAERERKELSLNNNNNISNIASADICSRLVYELDGLWDNITFIHPSLTCIELFFYDSFSRKHIIKIQFPDLYPSIPPECFIETPEEINILWKDSFTIHNIIKQYKHKIDKYNILFNQLDDIDNNTWVLEPDKPTYSIINRRIALENHCSIQIQLILAYPTRIPQCKFLGSEKRISYLRSKLHSNYQKWDENNKTVRENLENILEIKFPLKPKIEEETNMECAICYSYKMDNNIPDQTCDNNKCNKAFHHLCLYEWLRAASSRTSFDTLFGSCPNCFEDISVKVIK